MKLSIPEFLNELQRRISAGEIMTRYAHDIKISPSKIYADCSGFVAWVLMMTGRKAALREIRNYKYMNQKISSDWNKIFVREFVYALEGVGFSNWLCLSGPEELLDGDIIFSTDMPMADNTNHCMFVRQCEKLPGGEFKITVMDSSLKYIHYNDTKNAPGIGTGEIFITRTAGENFSANYSPEFPNQRRKLLFARVV